MSDTACLPFVQNPSGWIILLSLAPSNAVQIAVITFSIIITTARVIDVFRPKSVNARIEMAVRRVEESIDDAEDHQLLDKSGIYEIAPSIEENLKRLQFQAAQLREITFRTSFSPWGEIKEICKGHSYHLLCCLWAVWALESEVEIAKARGQQRQYQV